MPKSIFFGHEMVIVYKVLISRIVRRIDIDEVDFALVCLEEQLQGGEVVAFEKKVHLTAVVDEQAAVLGQYRCVRSENFVYFLTVFLKHETVFLTAHVTLKFGEIGKQIACVLVLFGGGDECAYCLYFGEEFLTLLL